MTRPPAEPFPLAQDAPQAPPVIVVGAEVPFPLVRSRRTVRQAERDLVEALARMTAACRGDGINGGAGDFEDRGEPDDPKGEG